MSQTRSWVLTDVASGLYVEDFGVTNSDLGVHSPCTWSIRKRRLRGGLSDGVDLIEIHNGELSFSICPTRGMGIWRGSYQGWPLGWNSPVHGPVHPAFVNREELGAIGWLQGFDEWIVRCGLSNNGAPAEDRLLDNTGAEQSMSLPLHGKIANLPAQYVEIMVETQPPYGISVIGQVDEAMLFFPQLRLETEIRTVPGSNRLTISDRVSNVRSQPAELELLYHCNFGPPLLEEGAKLRAPIERLVPINEHSAKSIESWDTYPGPTPGVIEECFLAQLLGDAATGKTLAVLENSIGNKACALRFSKSQLPYFTIWRNPAAVSDGYVTGLEPGTDFPNARPFERQNGRVVTLAPGESYDTELSIELADSEESVAVFAEEVDRIQRQSKARIEKKAPAEWAPS